LEELETILLAWFKQAHTANSSVSESHMKEEALHVAACLGINHFWASDGWIDCSKKIHNLVYKNISGESAIVNPKTLMDWKSEELPKIIDGFQPRDIFNVDETGLCHNLQPSKTVTYKGDSCYGGTKSQQRVTVLLSCIADVMEELSSLVTGKCNKPHCFINVKKLPTNYTANSSLWMASATFEDFLVQLDRQIGAKNRKILLFIDQSAAHPGVTTAMKGIKVIFPPPDCTKKFATSGYGDHPAFKCLHRTQLMWNVTTMIEGVLLGDAGSSDL